MDFNFDFSNLFNFLQNPSQIDSAQITKDINTSIANNPQGWQASVAEGQKKVAAMESAAASKAARRAELESRLAAGDLAAFDVGFKEGIFTPEEIFTRKSTGNGGFFQPVVDAVQPILKDPAGNYIAPIVDSAKGLVEDKLAPGLNKILGAAGLGNLSSLFDGLGGGSSTSSPAPAAAQFARSEAANPVSFGDITSPAAIAAMQLAAPQDSAFRGNQQTLIDLLTAQSQGRGGPSPAELLLKQQQDQNLQQAMALAASQSGRALPAAQRQVMNLQATGAQEALRNAAILRAQEQQQVQNLLASTLQGARGQDQAFAQQLAQQQQAQAGLNMDASKFNVSSMMDSEKSRASIRQAEQNALESQRQRLSQENQAQAKLDTDTILSKMAADAATRAAEIKAQAEMRAGLLNAGASILTKPILPGA